MGGPHIGDDQFAAGVARAGTIRRREDEAEEDWERLLEELRSNDGLEMSPREDGVVALTWGGHEGAVAR
ncbi:TPA: DUF1654 domain-containing protein [Pseudomonas aeruginosa]|uniref:DUF1654 domain-containing protein n=1 Tax=Pseudomonas aeruginosa TaxID=287 RepID=UPI000998C46D|nr:DUF1654 domain-containing protein [Pseudomonas aeruginosa]MBH3801529.1 DUF1654 domain-containing protein [Pseudomonas aeruginosa]MBI7297083.1 DUF1654 domain-containing protein [Pseudomonas aeruginosa]OWJ19270.1 hypothetical protein CDC07_08975 [Pseudomonas aeruginosa]UJF43024.1 DUF1654 domain-containing protein [Pseudomonas aeruginosa]